MGYPSMSDCKEILLYKSQLEKKGEGTLKCIQTRLLSRGNFSDETLIEDLWGFFGTEVQELEPPGFIDVDPGSPKYFLTLRNGNGEEVVDMCGLLIQFEDGRVEIGSQKLKRFLDKLLSAGKTEKVEFTEWHKKVRASFAI